LVTAWARQEFNKTFNYIARQAGIKY
jgi:hypothetical protein